LMEFTNFVAAADAAGINVMLDSPFNHTAFDCELADSGVFYFSSNSLATNEIRNTEARFYSRTDAYDMRASSASNVAVAPDRYDFGKFSDTHDVYFGRYAALVPNSSQSGNYLRSFIHLGFNQDEAGRIVFDGSNPNIAARVIDLNRRFALPGGDVDLYGLGTEAPVWWEDWNDVPRGRGTSGLLDRSLDRPSRCRGTAAR